MRNVQCHECGKRYNFDVDDFCPRCGAFTQPPRGSQIGADGTVVRVDGINERNHKNSFVHAELHEEKRKRKGSLLESVGSAMRNANTSGVRLTGQKPRGTHSSGDVFSEVADLLSDIFG